MVLKQRGNRLISSICLERDVRGIMNRYYLIDYENVNSEGFLGCHTLTGVDHIIIFFYAKCEEIRYERNC